MTRICIIGAGPAGLLLGHLLRAEGVDCIVLERRSPAYVLSRIRAGVLERGTVALMERLGLDARLKAEGLVHDGFNLADGERLIRIDIADLVGSHVVVYGQTELTRDLMDAREARGLEVVYEAQDVTLHAVESDAPYVTYVKDGVAQRVDARIIVGCDGFHGPSRQAIPASVGRDYGREYPFGWLGILADVPPCNDELIYANHEHGFALASMRSPTRSRYYIQCALDDRLEDWSDDRVWDEVCLRLGPTAAAKVVRGPSFEKSIAPLRSFVAEPMRWGRLFLAGDAAHIVPPTGAKGLNLAVSDVTYLSEALVEHYRERSAAGLDNYSARALARVWKAERFSWWFTSITHRFPNMDGFDRRIQMAELDYIRGSENAQRVLAENYVGLPLD